MTSSPPGHEPADQWDQWDIPTRSAVSVLQLRRLLHDDSHVHAAVVAYPTWAELRQAGRTDLGHVLGAAGVGIHLPDLPSTGLDLIDGYSPVTRYSITFPRNVLDLRTPPVMFYVRGTVPDGVAVAIVGSQYPSPEAVEVARNSASAAGGLNQIVVANMSNAVGYAALSTAVDVGARAIAVLAHSPELPTTNQRLIETVLARGGAVLYPGRPRSGLCDATNDTADATIAALATTVVITESGGTPQSGAAAVRTAVLLGRYLVAAAPQMLSHPAHHLPVNSWGLQVLTHPRAFTSEYYGTNARILTRLSEGRPAADAVVSNGHQLATALAHAANRAR